MVRGARSLTLGKKMNTSSSSSFGKQFAILVGWIAGSFICGLAACFGASISGLEVGPQGLGMVLYFFYGVIGGAVLIPVISLILSARGKSESSFFGAFMISPVTVLLIGAVSIPILKSVDGISWKSRQEFREESKQKYDKLYIELEHNPEIAIEENWGKGDYEHALVFEASWADENIPYTENQLGRIYASNPKAYNVFYHPACSPEFLASHFHSAYHGNSVINDSTLEAIAGNPKTPRKLLEKIAATKRYGATRQAKRMLEYLDKQQAEQVAGDQAPAAVE